MLRSLHVDRGQFEMFLPDQNNQYGLQYHQSLFTFQTLEPLLHINEVHNNRCEVFNVLVVEFEVVLAPVSQVHDEHGQRLVQVQVGQGVYFQ